LPLVTRAATSLLPSQLSRRCASPSVPAQILTSQPLCNTLFWPSDRRRRCRACTDSSGLRRHRRRQVSARAEYSLRSCAARVRAVAIRGLRLSEARGDRRHQTWTSIRICMVILFFSLYIYALNIFVFL
jgi:hypothetical protein